MGRFLHALGAFAARHAVVVLIVWVILAVGMVGLVKTYGAKTNNNLSLPGTDSQQAFDILAAKFPPQENGTNPFVFHVDRGKLTDPANAAALDATYAAIKRSPHVYSVMNPVSKNGKAAGLLSKDGRTGFMPVLLDINSGFITERLAEVTLEAAAPAEEAGIQVAVGGSIGSTLSAPDTKTSEVLGNIAAMVVLALVFGSLVAMGTPIVTAIFALSVAISAIGLLGHVVGIPSVGPTIATMIGLGVGIDYALFLVTKHKDQLEEGVEPHDSIARATASSGSAIVFAGGTVVIALLCARRGGDPARERARPRGCGGRDRGRARLDLAAACDPRAPRGVDRSASRCPGTSRCGRVRPERAGGMSGHGGCVRTRGSRWGSPP